MDEEEIGSEDSWSEEESGELSGDWLVNDEWECDPRLSAQSEKGILGRMHNVIASLEMRAKSQLLKNETACRTAVTTARPTARSTVTARPTARSTVTTARPTARPTVTTVRPTAGSATEARSKALPAARSHLPEICSAPRHPSGTARAAQASQVHLHPRRPACHRGRGGPERLRVRE